LILKGIDTIYHLNSRNHKIHRIKAKNLNMVIFII